MEFSELKIIREILKAVEYQGYKRPSRIQEKAIPVLLEGRDVLGLAQTGTGKTAAFLIPILQKLTEKRILRKENCPRALILAPTRELAAQIDKSAREYGRFLDIRNTAIFGGVKQAKQVKEIKEGAEIVIATPGRLLDLIQQEHLSLSMIEIMVLDEADRMFDMGFVNDIKRIIGKLPSERQSMCFSATMSKEVEQVTKLLLRNPVKIEISPESRTVEKIRQEVMFVDQKDKDWLLYDLLEKENIEKGLVFTRTKYRANRLSSKLKKKGIKADAIHGNKTQNQRIQALSGFKKGRTRILVATDIAARGIDVSGISHVINYDLPNETESYIHRIGRTARAGAEGIAYSFCSSDERGYLTDIERLIRQKIIVRDHERHSKDAQEAKGKDSRSANKQKRRGDAIRKDRSKSANIRRKNKNRIHRRGKNRHSKISEQPLERSYSERRKRE